MACVSFYKGKFLQVHAKELTAADKDGKRTIMEFKASGQEGFDTEVFLEVAVTWGVWPDAAMKARGYVFPVPLCWAHVEGITLMLPGDLTQAAPGMEDQVAKEMEQAGVPVPGASKRVRERPSQFPAKPG